MTLSFPWVLRSASPVGFAISTFETIPSCGTTALISTSHCDSFSNNPGEHPPDDVPRTRRSQPARTSLPNCHTLDHQRSLNGPSPQKRPASLAVQDFHRFPSQAKLQ
jgi:hypothetical protein